MLFVNYDINAPIDEVRRSLAENDKIVSDEKFDTSKGFPKIHIKEKGERVKIKCEFCGRARKDNGFLEGTYFMGKIRKSESGSKISGVVLTAPIYHIAVTILAIVIIIQCVYLKAFNPIPLFAVLFDILMFKNEFKKQGYIQRYIMRAIARLEKKGIR